MSEVAERTNREERPVRRRNPQATRNRLLFAARRRFAGLGYERTTLRDVAADADVNVACLSEPMPLLVSTRTSEGSSIAEALVAQLLDLPKTEDSLRNPLMLWLRGSGDERSDALRTRAIEESADAILQAAGCEPTTEQRLRAQFVIALCLGIATVRATIDLQPLASAPADELLGPLADVVRVLLGVEPSRDVPPPGGAS
jgi:hypothetical protein